MAENVVEEEHDVFDRRLVDRHRASPSDRCAASQAAATDTDSSHINYQRCLGRGGLAFRDGGMTDGSATGSAEESARLRLCPARSTAARSRIRRPASSGPARPIGAAKTGQASRQPTQTRVEPSSANARLTMDLRERQALTSCRMIRFDGRRDAVRRRPRGWRGGSSVPRAPRRSRPAAVRGGGSGLRSCRAKG